MGYQFSSRLGHQPPVAAMYVPVDLEAVAIDGAADYLSSEPVKAPANYKDETKIAAYIAEATAARLNRLALDPDLCRIVALGWRARGQAMTFTARDEADEYDLLDRFWVDLGSMSTVTFNGLAYDLPVIMRRSQYLMVPSARRLNLDKYRTPHVDLMQVLSFNGVLPSHSLRFYCQRFDLPCSRPDLTGPVIGALVAAGKYEEVEAHCADDVAMTAMLAARLGYAVLPVVAEGVGLPDAIF